MKFSTLFIGFILAFAVRVSAQFDEPLSIYGFTQSIYLNKNIDFKIKDNPLSGLPPATGGIENDAFVMQQLNLFSLGHWVMILCFLLTLNSPPTTTRS